MAVVNGHCSLVSRGFGSWSSQISQAYCVELRAHGSNRCLSSYDIECAKAEFSKIKRRSASVLKLRVMVSRQHNTRTFR